MELGQQRVLLGGGKAQGTVNECRKACTEIDSSLDLESIKVIVVQHPSKGKKIFFWLFKLRYFHGREHTHTQTRRPAR